MATYMTIHQLSEISGVPIRAIRRYITLGALSKPDGRTRNSRYLDDHLHQLTVIKKMVNEGYSLEHIRNALVAPELPRTATAKTAKRATKRKDKEVEVRYELDDGFILVIQRSKVSMTERQEAVVASKMAKILSNRS